MAALAKCDDNMLNTQRAFPAEAYDYNDDVTVEGVAFLRAKAKAEIENDEWEVIDGIGDISAS